LRKLGIKSKTILDNPENIGGPSSCPTSNNPPAPNGCSERWATARDKLDGVQATPSFP